MLLRINNSYFSGPKLIFRFRMAFRRSFSSSYNCDQSIIKSGALRGSGGSWRARCSNIYCSSTIIANTGFQCTDYSVDEDWTKGESNFTYTFSSESTEWVVSYHGCCWISSLAKYPAGNWLVSTTVNLTRRSDTGRINSSPVSKGPVIIRFEEGCPQSFRIPVEDSDDDVVKCRWATYSESYRHADSFPHGVIDERACLLHYNGRNGTAGTYAVALTLEDFPEGTTNFNSITPFSAVGLQFLVTVSVRNGYCTSVPLFTKTTPRDGECTEVKIGLAYRAVIEAKVQDPSRHVTEIVTSSPVGMQLTSLQYDALRGIFYRNVTWYPRRYQVGQQLFCFRASDSVGSESEWRCITILVGLKVNERGSQSRKKRYAWWSPVTTSMTTPSPSPTSGYFNHAIGVQDPSIIPDNQMTASSYYSSSYYPHFGRLHDIRGGGWAGSAPSNPSDWLQVDFGSIALVCAVATQGDTYGSEWVIDFSLSFSSDGASWFYSRDSQGNKMVFTRMGNNSYVDRQTLPAPMSARYIRFHPISQHSWNTLRVEVYEAVSPFTTSAPDYFHHAIGVQDPSIIPDNQMTASSYYSSSYYPHFGRLHDIRGGGWAGSVPSNPSDWLQVDFGRIALVCAVETQGDTYGNEWVIDFSLSFSSDGASWFYSRDSQGNKMVFTRMGNNSYVDRQTLPAPMSARYIRFHPISQHSWNTLRVEVYEVTTSSPSRTSAFSLVTTSAPVAVTTPSPSPTSVASSSSPSTLGCFHHAIGVQDPSIIPDNQMTASSYYSSSYYPHFGRLHDIRGGGWAGSAPSNPSDWLQVDFGRIALVCAVETQGDTYGNEWVIDFSLSFSSDGASWFYSRDSQGNKMVFTRMGNNFFVDQKTLPAPMSARYIRFHPISQHSWNTLRVEVYEVSPFTTSAPDYFHHAIGVQDPSIIPDNQMTASSYYSSSYYPHFGRLHDIRGGGWAGSVPSNPSDWLQVDFGRIALVCAVETQGDTYGNEWVIDFSLSFSSDGASWFYSRDSQGNKMVFTRMGNNSYVDRQTLPAPMSARYIRFHPISQHSWNTLRVEVYEVTTSSPSRTSAFSLVTTSAPVAVTTPSPSPTSVASSSSPSTLGCFHHAIGVQDPSIIPDNQMTASSYYSSSYYPHFGRLHDIRGGGWAGSAPSNPSDWLQVDFGRIALVCAVETQGDTYGNEWVIDFSLSFSSDGASWFYSRDSQGNKMVFTRMGNNFFVDQKTLPAPMSARYIRFHPISQHSWNTLRVEVYEAVSPFTTSAPDYFHHAIGVQDPSIIPDNQMTASSYYSSSYYPHFGRLHDIRGGGWAGSVPSNPSDWLQVDFGRIALVCAVETQGDTYGNEWVIDFSLSFSSDGASWFYSRDSQGNKMVFTRMGNNSYVDRQTLPAPMSARYIRFHPISQHSWNTLRVEVYEVTTSSPSRTSAFSLVTTSAPVAVTTPSPSPTSVASSSSPSTLGYFHHAIGVQDPSIIPDNQMTASSYYSSSYYPHFGRLHDIRGGGWAGSAPSNPSDWLQVDFGRIALVCAVATQGDTYGSEWVIDFSLSFSSDGASWVYSSDSQGNKMVFTRMGNNSYVDRQTLPAPISARYIRFHPKSQHSWNTLRVEVYEAFSPVTTSAHEPDVTVSCGEQSMALSIEKQSFSFVRVEQVHLRYSSCKATENGTHVVISTLLNDCGTSVNETEHALLFWNEVQVDAVIIDGVITRSHDIRLPFYCSYSRKKLVSLSFNPRGIYFGQEAGYGNFTFKLDFFKSGSFVVPYSTADYPLELRLDDYLHVRYSVESSADLVIMAENCRATKDGSFYSLPHYNIIKNGCGRDTTMIYSYNSNRPYQEFRIKVFRFFNGYSSIYLHCELLACHRSSINSRCQRGCLPGRRRKRRAVIGDGTEHVESTTKNIVSRGPLIFKDEVKQGDTGQSKKEGALIGGVVGAGAVCVLAFAALGIVFVKYRVARRLMNRNKVGDLYVTQEEEIGRNNAYIQEDDMNTKEDSL
ncbi:uncharacterized protein [Acropora muricata]|uniref:uncharacterized protein isoform X3 n=1 Tax=Acropora muricata TaxID=159855 RepID=UPI0034E5FA7D